MAVRLSTQRVWHTFNYDVTVSNDVNLRHPDGHDQRTWNRSFGLGDTLFIKNIADGPTWLPSVVAALHGLLTYDVKLGDGRVVRCHIDHVQSRASHPPPTETEDDCLPGPSTIFPGPSSASSEPAAPQTELQRSTRVPRPPDRFM